MKKLGKSSVKTIVVMVLIAAAIVVIYFMISKRSDENVEPTETATEVQKILDKDLSSDYPVTSREVIKLYCRILNCFYNETLNDDDLIGLIDQLRLIYDDELLKVNQREDHIMQIKGDVVNYEKENIRLSSYKVDSANNITTWKKDGFEYAQVYVLFTQKIGVDFSNTCEKFLLRKDKTNKWKIVGWELADISEMER